eukprot:7940403-Ditylum_brightwellii.AAC.1
MEIGRWRIDALLDPHQGKHDSSTLHQANWWWEVTSIYHRHCLSWPNYTLYHSPPFTWCRPDIQTSTQYLIKEHGAQ